MASQGPNSPGTTTSDSSAGGTAWTNPTNVTSSNNVRATIAVLGVAASSEYLKVTNFGFSIPSGATIDGIVVDAEVSDSLFLVNTTTIKLVKGGTISGTNRASDSSGGWSSTESYKTYGSSSQLWGLSWTDSDINDSTFGAAIICSNPSGKSTASPAIDHIRITVHYTTGGGGPTSTSALMLALD